MDLSSIGLCICISKPSSTDRLIISHSPYNLARFELKIANRLRTNIHDVAEKVETGVSFGKEIAGRSVVDMQVLLYNTRNMNKLKDRYVQRYKLDSTELMTTAKRLNHQINHEIQNPASHNDGTTPLMPFNHSRPIVGGSMSSSLGATKNTGELDLLTPSAVSVRIPVV